MQKIVQTGLMDKSAADAYVYSKVCGKLSKAYSGKKAAKLYAAKSLSELYNLLFAGDIPAVPENLLAKEIEAKAGQRFVDEYVKLLACYSKPEQVLLSLLQFYDYDNLKEIAGALCMKENQRPELLNIGQYSLLDYEVWPDIAKITSPSTLSWYNKVPDITKQQEMDTKLDFQYLRELWDSVNKMETSVRAEAVSLFTEEIQYSNIMWVLRLKVYYKMKPEEIRSKLFFENPAAAKSASTKKSQDILAGEAVKLLEKDPSNFEDWKNWKFKSLLNPHEDGVIWEIDPRWVENAAHAVMMNKYAGAFHKYPLSSLALVCYFKIKENELNNIRRVTESLRLGGE